MSKIPTSRFGPISGRALLPAAGAAAAAVQLRPSREQILRSWESLAREYRAPEWFRDVKFGIWSHWGPQCVPEAGD